MLGMKDILASPLLLDITGAFDHVSHRRLIYNLKKSRVDLRTANWIASFLQDNTATIQLGN
jgi:hypothetical protein